MRTECNAEASMNHRTTEDRMTNAKPWGRRVRLWMCLALLQCSVTQVAAAQDGAPTTHDGDAAYASAHASTDDTPAPERSIEHGHVSADVSAPDDDVHAAYERAMKLYREEVKDLDRTIRDIVDAEYRSRRARINAYFQAEVDALRVEERALRGRAIDEFETFLRRFPDDPDHTPDALFRLAELYYEKTEDQFLIDDLAYEDQYRQYEQGLIAEPPEEVDKDFSKSIELFERLVQNFPDYRQVDGAWYLLAISHLQMYNDDEARDAFETLVHNYPDSEFAQEAYLRIGEEYFTDKEFQMARSAYGRALLYGDSVWYDKIVFKLGWANYQVNNYDEAIQNFTTLLEYYVAKADRSSQAVREEALQYFAIVLGEQDWDLDGQTDDDFVLERALKYLSEDRPYTIEVFDRLAGILSEYAEGGGANFYATAQSDVLRHVIERFPLDAKNPERHNDLIGTLFRTDQIREALLEGEQFIARYAMGSEWYRAQEKAGNFEEIAYAESASRSLLVEAGVILYNEAEALAFEAMETNDADTAERARRRYRGAAAAFGKYLEDYPNDSEAYQVRMYRAQSLLNSGQYLAAAEEFDNVRDSKLSNEFQSEAASLSIDSYAKALIEAIDQGQIQPRAYPPYASLRNITDDGSSDDDDSGELRGAPANEPIPELTLKWVDAIDAYTSLGIENEDDPETAGKLAFAAARVFYDYHHYDTATERFEAVVRGYCGQKETGFAAALLIDTYRVRKDYTQVEYWTNEIQRLGSCVQVPDYLVEAFEKDLERFRMGAVADKAEQYYADGEYEKAAEEYRRLTTDYADSDFAPLGLYNAGQIYENDLRDYRRAMEQFEELITRYPKSEYVDDALVRIAVNSTNFFDFDKAIATYMELERRGYSDADRGLESPLLTAADLLRFTQQYDEAARAYIRYADQNPRNAQAPAALYIAAQVYDDAGNHNAMLDAYERYRRKYGNVSNALIDGDLATLSSYIRERDLARSRGRSRDVEKLDALILKEFDAKRPSPTPSSWASVQHAVGEILYDRANASFEAWDDKSLGTQVATQQKRIAERIDGMPALRDQFNEVVVAGSAEWTICAKYQQGMIYKRMSDQVAQMPPPEFQSFEEEDMYYDGSPDGSWPGVDAIVRQWEDQALKDWSEDGYPVAQRTGVYNECARSMLAELHRVAPDEYPVYRTEIRAMGEKDFTPSSIVSPPARHVKGGARLGDRPVDDENDVPEIDLNFGGDQ